LGQSNDSAPARKPATERFEAFADGRIFCAVAGSREAFGIGYHHLR
jgi:hypothetical protein